MLQTLAGLLVFAVYAGAFIALIRGPGVKPRSPLDRINTDTKEGRLRYIREAARLARQAAEDLKDGID